MTEPRPNPVAWVTGAGGLIGSHLVSTQKLASDWKVVGLTRAELDLTDADAVIRRFHAESPALVIHCAANSSSVECEKTPALARVQNVEVTARLAELCANAQFIFLSTDLVFDGRKGNYTEADSVSPLGIYAETKVAAEQIVLANPRHTIVRTSLNGGKSPKGNRGFDEQARNAWHAGQSLRLFTDEFRSPIDASVTARAIWELALANATGLFHVAGAERLSRFELGQLLAARWPELNPRIEAASLKEYHGAPRPPDCSLNCAKVQALLSFPLPRYSDWLASTRCE
ncbi:MAG TPA: SDR family oxidoreductase [Verrucomicrobiae bacterium]|nr:SDR family oxidoreductase [Verrucomicrobiae bacterium]